MAACQLEIDLFVFKAQRAATRRQNLQKKRSDYLRSRLARSQPPLRAAEFSNNAEHAKVKPHRILRTATRTYLAKGILETPSDIPCLVSMGRAGRAGAPRKPAVAPVLSYARSEAALVEPHCCSQEYLDWLRSAPCAEALDNDFCLDSALDLAEAETTATEASDGDAAGSEPEEELTQGSCFPTGEPKELLGADPQEGNDLPNAPLSAEPEEELAHEDETGWELLPCSTRDADADGSGWSLIA